MCAQCEECSNVSSDAETLNLLTRKFSKFLKKKEEDKDQQNRRYCKKYDIGFSNFTCFGCGK